MESFHKEKNMLYSTIILLTMFLNIGMTVTISIVTNTYSLAYAILSPIYALVFVLVLLGALDLILRIFPKSLYSYKHKFYVASKREIRFYEKIGIKKWKDKVPELGATGGFSKKNIKSLDSKYIARFIYETCFGEILHLLAALLGFLCLLFFPARHFYVILPVLIVNFVLNILPCFIQRYNRHKLTTLYEYLKRKEVRVSNLQEIAENKEEIKEIQEEKV